MADAPWPREIRLAKDRRSLTVVFDDGARFGLPAEYLRVFSPSAEVTGHAGQARTLVSGKRDVAIERVEPVGRYAVRLVFSDGHATGLYSWPTLYDLGSRHAENWQGYLDELAAARRSRDVQPR